MMKPPAKIAPTAINAAVFSIISFISSAASATPIADAIVVFLVSAISTEPSGSDDGAKSLRQQDHSQILAERQAK